MGSAASAIPPQVDLNAFRRLSGGGGPAVDALFETYAVNGAISKEKLFEIAQGTDCFFSHHDDLNQGKNTRQRVGALFDALSQKGLLIAFDKTPFRNSKNISIHIQHGIEKTRSAVIFVTKQYIERVNANSKTDACVIEFHSIIRKKGLDQCVLVLMDTASKDRSGWGQAFGLFSNHQAVVDMSTDDRVNGRIDELHKCILSLSQPESMLTTQNSIPGDTIPSTKSVVSISEPQELTRADVQFSEWLSRSTKISEPKRVMYCSILLKTGVHSTQDLALKMASNENFLVKLGFDVSDAESIAMAIRDLGLGNNLIRDFNHGNSIETIFFAINKSTASPNDHELAASAFSCISRVANISPSMALLMSQAGIAAATVKLLQQHIGSESSAREALRAIDAMAVDESIVHVFVAAGACNVITQCMVSHPDNVIIQAIGAWSIQKVGSVSDARVKFGQAGACEAIVKAMSRHFSSPEVAEATCAALNQLSMNCVENNAKFGSFGAPAALCKALIANQSNAAVLRVGLHSLQISASISENRVTLGDNGIAKCIVAGLASCGSDDPTVAIEGCIAASAIVVGSAINRTRLSQAGGCEVATALLKKYATSNPSSPEAPNVIRAICKALFALGAGNSDNQKKLYPVKPLLISIVNNKQLPDELRLAAREADSCIQVR